MHNAIEATDIIYGNSIQVLQQLGVDPALFPLVMDGVANRVNAFHMGDAARSLRMLREASEGEGSGMNMVGGDDQPGADRE